MNTGQVKQHRIQYHQWQTRLKISFIFVNCALTVLFWVFPKFETAPTLQTSLPDIQITLEDIPVTVQEIKASRVERPNPATDISVNFSDEPEWPDSIAISSVGEKSVKGKGSIENLSFKKARIIFEQYPALDKHQCRGKVKLLLLVDKNGRVTDLEIIENSTGSSTCLEAAKTASLRSRWLPAMQGQSRVASWVEKVYVFGAPR